MLVAQYDPQTFALVRTIESLSELKRWFPRYSGAWDIAVTQEHLTVHGIPASIVTEVAQPTLAFGESATFTAVRQGETWLQVWTVQSITLADAKASLLARADELLSNRVPLVNPVLLQVFTELQVAETEFAASMTPTAGRFPLINAIAVARGITLAQAGTNVVKPLRDQWRARAGLFVAKYVSVVSAIAAATTIAEAKALLDELEAISG